MLKEKFRIKRLFERFKNGKKLTYTDGPYRISTGGYDCHWEFYVNGIPYVTNIAEELRLSSQGTEEDLKFIEKIWKEE